MTRADLMAALAARFPSLSHTDAQIAVKLILEAIATSLASGARVEIRDFGSFDRHHRPARTGRNPATGESVRVPAKTVPHFKPGKGLRERVACAGASAGTGGNTTDTPAGGQ
ncbi:MAG: integration host factor subunit beta [Phycisphaerales bacterium]|nr:integration host factor subunit beta [Phycisphaerales bacterium]